MSESIKTRMLIDVKYDITYNNDSKVKIKTISNLTVKNAIVEDQ